MFTLVTMPLGNVGIHQMVEALESFTAMKVRQYTISMGAVTFVLEQPYQARQTEIEEMEDYEG